MAKVFALLALGCFLLAGCGSTSADDPVEPASTATFSVTGDNRIAPVVLTDTLHLLAPPDLATRAPDSYTDLRLPVPPFSEQATAGTGATTPRLEWRLVAPTDLQGIVGMATVWVDVQGTVLSNPNPLAEHCFWEFRFLTGDEATGNSYFAPCVAEDAQVAAGVRAVEFAFDLPAVAVAAGETLRFEMYTQDFGRAPGATVDVLTGSVVHDSRVQIAGLLLPLDAERLLSTT